MTIFASGAIKSIGGAVADGVAVKVAVAGKGDFLLVPAVLRRGIEQVLLLGSPVIRHIAAIIGNGVSGGGDPGKGAAAFQILYILA